ncbi:putative mitochondrial glutamate carrier protein [Schistosoma mansoni]|uniref:Mitochondrial glutamate carrier 2 n=1 Tax=Schistosoma mansoni TaxID=6183 RepID=G4VK90_SCHMA|nr:putative mitochondrial glutamate carrier protein [Schistosoma mansoni]|eukprot:XP_018652700.1 putative mitochondrial glutamate carrier protein [Schistosoma mansoni]
MALNKESVDSHFSFVPKVVNGGIAGVVGVTCVFPIDLVKTRMQNQQSGRKLYKNVLDCAAKTYRAEGFFGMYRGSGVNLLLITPEKAIKLVGNDFFRYHLKPEGKPLTPIREMFAGAGAGTCQIIITTPMELLKIQLQDAGRTSIPITNTNSGGTVVATRQTATQLAIKLVREKGIFGLYRGMRATFLRDVSFSMIYFPLFANFNALGPRRSPNSVEAVFYWSFLSGFLSGTIAAFSVTPFDVVKTRLQTIKHIEGEKVFKGITDCFMQTLRDEGVHGLFKGAGCRVMVMAPLFGIAQTVYYLGVAERILGYPRY